MQSLQSLQESVTKSNIAELISATQNEDNALLRPVSIYFLSNFTINPIEPILKYYLLESKALPEIKFGQYDNIIQEILDAQSPLHAKKFDLIVCANYYDHCDPFFLNRLKNLDSFINDLKILFDLLQEKTSGLVLTNTLLFPFFSETGIASIKTASQTEAILEINRFIQQYVKQNSHRFFLMDWCRYNRILGKDESIDHRYWFIYKAPFKKNFLNLYSLDIAKIVRALHGHGKKCLILDCDNTLWGGIVGEDGLSGIQLDSQNYPGRIFYEFQQSVIDIAKRGVILAICSKNNESDVWEIFDNHPHCLLRREHFASYKINWANKANNIHDLIRELNISIESCVFIDDSPTECELIKKTIPEISVIQVPVPLYEYPTLLYREGCFDTLAVNAEDAQRNIKYQQESMRKQILKNSLNIEEYLASLELIATIHPIIKSEVPRVAQLTQKTNQFNLSTKRYTEQQINELSSSRTNKIFSLTVKDKFGDYGLTGVFIANLLHNKGIVDSFLLSCRILSRHLEHVFLETCLNRLSKEWGINFWEAIYIPTDKNSQIKNFLIETGFKSEDEKTYWIDIKQWPGFNINHITIAQAGHEYA